MSRAFPKLGATRPSSRASLVLALALTQGALLAPGADPAAAAGGGAKAPQVAQSNAEASTPPAQVSGIPTPVRTIAVSGGMVTLRTRSAGIQGQSLAFTGSVPARDGGEQVRLERLTPANGLWTVLARGRVQRDGAFSVEWRADVAGQLSIRAVVVPASQAGAGAEAALSQASGPAQLTIYHAGVATYFGPGLYGEKTACGQMLTPWVIGVANRTLPCGTLVAVSYGAKTLVVPVIDRGPYRAGVNWDLTYRAAVLLGAEGMEQVGTMIVGSSPNTPLLGIVPGLGEGEATGGSEAAPAA